MTEADKATTEEITLSIMNEIAAEMSLKLDAKRPAWEPSDHSKNNWCSESHHPCLKNLVHCRVDWRKRQAMDIGGRWRVDEGIRIEWEAKKWLGDIGYEITQSQRRFSTDDPGLEKYKHLHLSGKIDGASPLKRDLPEPFQKLREVPIEFKTVNPHFWDSTKTIQDIKRHSKFWINKIPSQLNDYILFFNSPGGFLVMATFGKRPRIIPMLFDKELWEYDVQRIEKVNAHVDARTFPEPIPHDATICGMCDFNHICTPLKTTKMIEISAADEPELEFYLELKDWSKKFDAEHKRLIGTEKEPGRYRGKDAIAGNISISTTEQTRKTYDIPPEEKEKFRGKDKKNIITKIERISK